ncbi:hypothetical protein BT69DRAFT_879949 [Atractiella rhizophila]|nr:hypothetical protein BT69DRAFT_879949 [Atractiella rhizophila]
MLKGLEEVGWVHGALPFLILLCMRLRFTADTFNKMEQYQSLLSKRAKPPLSAPPPSLIRGPQCADSTTRVIGSNNLHCRLARRKDCLERMHKTWSYSQKEA